ncbi:MAG: hypothetical protein LBI04_09680 [Treponema sp.]|jgi:hypothetical protein|nr:hypothetical protein [Treponema sp.]
MTKDILVILLIIPSIGTLAWVYTSTYKAFRKYNSLCEPVQKKILLINQYMYLVRNLTIDELKKIETIPDEEIVCIDSLRDAEKIAESLKNYAKEYNSKESYEGKSTKTR